MKTKAPQVILQDFETEAIMPRPDYPPKPVSCALKWPDRSDWILMAWGHGDGSKAAGNNCTEREARAEYKKARESRWPMCFQNGMFDQDVAETHWDLPLLPWERYHDTMFLAFYHDPHSPSLALKPLAERYLGIPPEEQDRMYEWIIAHIPEAKRKPSTAGAYIARCPYQIVKPYHKGDLIRTGGLFNYLWPLVHDAEMDEAYERDRRLMPILLRNASRGMRVDVASLERDTPLMRAGVEKCDIWLRKRLGDINLDSPKQLGDALYSKKIVVDFTMTKGGNGAAPQRSTSKKHLTIDKFKDKQVYQALMYRSQMSTSLGTFMEAWLELAGKNDTIYPDWSQVRAPKGDGADTKGARSGRIICAKPNLLNIPKKWSKAVVAGYVHPKFIGKLPELPYIRTYALPHKGRRWGHRDFKMQELYLFSYFEEGPVMEGFLADSDYDIHELVRIEEERALVAARLRDSIDRDTAKNTVFARLYGQGITGLLETLKLSEDERPVAQVVQRALNAAIPSIKDLDNELKALARQGLPVRTWGGRLYYCEEPKFVKKFNRDMTFEYKLISYLIQGSGADVIKQCIVDYDGHPKRAEDMIVTVYDEINVDLPLSDKGARQEMQILKDCMASQDIKPLVFKSDGKVGPSWGALEKFAI